jgi:hypothetical protein
MPKPPAGNITVTTEIGYCPFCQRTRTLRREERHLGGLVRTNIDCETCHRTLSSTLGPPAPAPVEAPAEPAAPAPPATPAAPAKPEPPPKPIRAPVATKTKKPAASTAKKPATRAGSTAKKK